MTQLWRRNITLLIAAQNFFLFGSSAVYFAILWYIALKTSSGTWLTLATLATTLPAMLVSLWGGVWADRYNRKWLMIATSGLVSIGTFILAVVFVLGVHDLWVLLLIAVIRSTGSGVATPAGNALLPELVSKDRLTRANGTNQFVNSLLLLVSPIVSGWILGSVGIFYIFIVDLVTAMTGIALLIFIRVKKAQRTETKQNALVEIGAGLSYLRNNQFWLRFMIFTAVAFVLVAPSSQLSTLYVKRAFGTGVWRLTLNELLWTIGSLIGSAYMTTHQQLKRPLRIIGAAITVSGVVFAMMGIPEPFWVYLAFMLLSGICMPIIQTTSNVMIQQRVSTAMMGRVFAVLQIVSTGIYPIAMLFFGPLADQVAIGPIFIVTGIIEIIVGFVFVRVLRESWRQANANHSAKN